MKIRFAVIALALTLAIPFSAFAVLDGENYDCAYPYSVTLDGDLSDWSGITFYDIPHDRGTAAAPDDADASISFAAVADDEWLYVAIDISDDTIQYGETDNWQDDSVEVYIDANHAETTSYENDDAQITIGALSLERDVGNPHITGSSGADGVGTHAAVVESDTGWIVEAGIPLTAENGKWDMQPAVGMSIGFQVHFNDDDDGGGRDHKLIWSDKDVNTDTSWNNTSYFGDLTFVTAPTAVEATDKLTTTWGSIKK